jgi:hypothetical protein
VGKEKPSEMEIVVVLVVWDNDTESNEECRRMEVRRG